MDLPVLEEDDYNAYHDFESSTDEDDSVEEDLSENGEESEEIIEAESEEDSYTDSDDDLEDERDPDPDSCPGIKVVMDPALNNDRTKDTWDRGNFKSFVDNDVLEKQEIKYYSDCSIVRYNILNYLSKFMCRYT